MGAASWEAAELFDLSMEDLYSSLFLEVFSGNRFIAGMKPFVTCYGGHQFGSWAGQLGDGRTINLAHLFG
ncbi:protein adenylyltransferase SelO family protein [Desulfobacter hydrogenophilus]|uniref:protein adenylyltransferase SelO family protein n=1 Tax=Desulfobacter hydrogenophilus TaxID=2291 RepID=UPI001F5EF661|nr:protein adenylyltransferase SelO family protein [Desulfobacter hydrogenophilus]